MLTNSNSSLENAIAGKYYLNVKPIVKEAFEKTKGVKKTYWAATALFILILVVLFLIESGIIAAFKAAAPKVNSEQIANGIFNILNNLVNWSLFPGLLLMGIRHVSAQGIRVKLLFRSWQKSSILWNLILGNILLILLFIPGQIPIAIGIFLVTNHTMSLYILGLFLIIIGILYSVFIGTATGFTASLIIEREIGAWQAVSTSFRAVTKHWFKVFNLLLITLLLLIAGLITLGIGLIWTLPMAYNLIGIQYREIFGVVPKPIEEIS